MSNEMNDVRLRLTTYRSEAELPEDLARALEQDPALKQYWDETRRIALLVGLKRHETPADLNLLRCRNAVRRELLAKQHRVGASGWFGWIHSPAALVRFGLATAFVGFVALYLFTPVQSPDLVPSGPALVVAEPTEPEPTILAEERPNPEFTPDILSNFMPRVQQHGPFRLVGHEQ